ncbi:N-alpha-acetyltransferase 35, NatC auxiliary subunit [Daldinia childiae]|uniref:N-alpha-acetyltransferase 35, NatC auxiliary subunit n=1 Tax=Daldinia childiae TaxID=326645 RepID=UPI00144752C6|nr:N-alpha-acetyltransferase 35, NatC auxiliary subunit [Daldinia childiae]KAF3067484.1 N-alpha-acetyltransferase 35, NatC auxiliary subunit [Daldinia childiae]
MQQLNIISHSPNISHPGVKATDITKKFASAVKTLAPGQLVKDDHFTLFESVAALEIMDRKMDSGALAEGESLDEEYDVSRDLLPEEILGIIDQLLCLEMAWHLGYPLSQTLFTSIYIESLMNPHPANIGEAEFIRDPQAREKQPKLLFVLRAYCLGLLKACCFVNELVKDELYYEEEDFVTNTYDRDLLLDMPVSSINNILQQARSDLRAASNEVAKDISAALDLRLELRIAFLRAIDLSGLRKSNPDSLKMPWVQMKGLLEHIKKQHSLGKPVPEAFSTKLQRRLASTMPPRPMVQPSFEESYDHLKRLFQDGVDIMDILKYSEPQSLLNFVLLFQARKPQPLVYIRTLLQNLLFREMVVLGNYSIRQIIDHDLSIVVMPCAPQIDASYDEIEVPTDPRHQTSAQMEIFRQRVAECYLDVFRIFCQNRCRVRRTLCHNIQEWDMLQVDVEEIDQLLQVALDERPLITDRGSIGFSLPLSSWAYLYKLRQMEWIVQLGFELEVYQTDELAGMYWYLNYLAKTRAQHGDRIKSFTMRSLDEARHGLDNSRKGDQELPQYTAAKEREYMTSLTYLRITMLDAACTWEFADGLCCLYTALQRLKLIALPQRPYSTDTMRYDLRMKPFRTITLPQLPTFDEFTRATLQPETPTPDLLKYAEGAIGGAKKGYEALSKMSDTQSFSVNAHDQWVNNIRDCLKAAIAAGVAVSTLQRALDRAGGSEDKDSQLKLKVEMPAPGKGYHDWWIVPKLVPMA